MNNLDLYRTAKLFIDQYGADASVQAALRADAMMERGDLEGVAVWKRIVRAIGDLQSTTGQIRH